MVKSGKLRSGTAQKVRRWKKGHSSDSNPEACRYRDAAKSRYFSRPSGETGLWQHVGSWSNFVNKLKLIPGYF